MVEEQIIKNLRDLYIEVFLTLHSKKSLEDVQVMNIDVQVMQNC